MTSWGGGILGDAWWWGGVREELEFEEELGIAVLIVQQRPSFPSSCLRLGCGASLFLQHSDNVYLP